MNGEDVSVKRKNQKKLIAGAALLSALLLTTNNGLVLANPAPGGSGHGYNLDLSSTSRTITYTGAGVGIRVGGTMQQFSSGASITPAEFVAIQQVLSAGRQSLNLNTAGAATSGQFIVGDKSTPLSGLLVPHGVTGVDVFSNGASTNVLGNLTNFGSIFGLSQNSSVTAGTIAAQNILNAQGGLISTVLPSSVSSAFGGSLPSLNLLLCASTITNAGSIASSGKLNLNGTLVNSGSIVAAQDVNIVLPDTTGSASLTNSGTIRSLMGTINVSAALASSNILVNGAGGSFQSAQSINFRDPSYSGAANINVSGGSYLSNSLNLYAGNGAIDVNAEQITGAINSVAGSEHVLQNSGTMTLGNNCVNGDPTYINNGSITISGLNTFAAPVAIIANGDIIASNNGAIVDPGNAVILVAGVFPTSTSPGIGTISEPPTPPAGGTTTPTTINFTNGANNGGSVNGTAAPTFIDTSSPTGTGGSVFIAALAAGPTGGKVLLGSSGINTSANTNGTSFNGNGGAVTIIAGSSAGGVSISAGDIVTSGGSGGTGGAVKITAAQPTAAGNVVFNSAGAITSGAILASNTIQSGSIISLGNVITAPAAQQALPLAVTTLPPNGGNAGAITITSGLAITAGNLLAFGGGGMGGYADGTVAGQEKGSKGGNGAPITLTIANSGAISVGDINSSGGGGGGGADNSGTGGNPGAGGAGGQAGTILINGSGAVSVGNIYAVTGAQGGAGDSAGNAGGGGGGYGGGGGGGGTDPANTGGAGGGAGYFGGGGGDQSGGGGGGYNAGGAAGNGPNVAQGGFAFNGGFGADPNGTGGFALGFPGHSTGNNGNNTGTAGRNVTINNVSTLTVSNSSASNDAGIIGTNVAISGLAGSPLSIVNSGAIAALANNGVINIVSAAGQNLLISGGGFMQLRSGAAAGSINIGAQDNLSGNSTATVEFVNGLSFLTNNAGAPVNITAAGPNQSVQIDNGAIVNADNNINLNTPKVTLIGSGNISSTGGTVTVNCAQCAGTLNATGNLSLNGNFLFSGQDFTLISGGDIVATGFVNIDLSSNTASGGNFTAMAGYNFGPNPGGSPSNVLINVGGPSSTGGSILLPAATLNTSSNWGGGPGIVPHAGNVSLFANAGSASTGQVQFGSINAGYGGGVSGSGGNVLVLAPGGATIDTSNGAFSGITTTSPNGTPGSVYISTQAPVVQGQVVIAGGILTGSGTVGPSGVPTSANVSIGNINAGSALVTLLTGATGGVGQGAGTNIAAGTLRVTAGSGGIGNSSQALTSSAASLAANSTGPVFLSSGASSLSLLPSNGTTFSLTTTVPGTASVQSISAINVTLLSTAAANGGSFVLNGPIGGQSVGTNANTVSITASGLGTIKNGIGVQPLISTNTLSLGATSGTIGTNLSPLQTNASTLNATTADTTVGEGIFINDTNTGVVNVNASSVQTTSVNGVASNLNYTGTTTGLKLQLTNTGTITLPVSSVSVAQDANGNGGTISLIGSNILYPNSGIGSLLLNATGSGSGNGGTVLLNTTSPAVNINVGAGVSNANTCTVQIAAAGGPNGGAGGTVTVNSAGNMTVDPGFLFANATSGNGATISLLSGGNLLVNGNLHADAGGVGNGGSVTLRSTSSTPFTVGAAAGKTTNGVIGTVTANGAGGLNGSVSVSNLNGNVTNAVPLTAFQSVSMTAGGLGSVVVGSNIGSATTPNVLLSATGAGSITQTGTITASSLVTLTGNNGGIGSAKTALKVLSPAVSAVASGPNGLVNVNDLQATGVVSLTGANGAGSSFTFVTPASVAVNSPITVGAASNPATLLIQTTGTKTPSSITVNNPISVGPNGTASLTAAGAGTISGVGLLSGKLVKLTSTTGQISLGVNAATVSANTKGAANVTNAALTPSELLLSTGSSFTYSAAGALKLDGIKTTNGAILVTSDTTTAGLLQTAPGAQISATNGAITLNNNNANVTSTIVLGAKSAIKTSGSVAENISIFIVAPLAVNTGAPANVSVKASTGGQAFFGANSITGVAPVNTVTVSKNSVVSFNTGALPSTAITLNGGVNLTAIDAQEAEMGSEEVVIDTSDDE